MERGAQEAMADRATHPAGTKRLLIGAVLVGILAPWAGASRSAAAQGSPTTRDDLPTIVLTEDDAPPGAQLHEQSGFYDLSQAAPDDQYGQLRDAGMEAVYRNLFDPWAGSQYLVSSAMLFPDADTASKGLSILVSEGNLAQDDDPPEGADEAFNALKMSLEDWVDETAWRRGNLVLHLTIGEEPADPPVPDLGEINALVERMNAKAAGGAGPGPGPAAGGSFTEGDLSALVLTAKDAPEGAAPSSSGPVDLSDVDTDSPSAFATLQAAGLQAVHQNCFDPWDGDHFLCSQALLFPNEGEASRGLGMLNLTGDFGLGDEGGWGTNENGDVLEAVWRRSNVLLWLTMLDQGASPSLSLESDALPLARQMDERAVALMGREAAPDEDAGGGFFGSPVLLIAAIAVFLLALGAGLWLLRRSRGAPAEQAEAPETETVPVATEAPAGGAAPEPAAAPPGPASGQAGQVKYCTNCGTPEEQADAKFCQSCGHPFG